MCDAAGGQQLQATLTGWARADAAVVSCDFGDEWHLHGEVGHGSVRGIFSHDSVPAGCHYDGCTQRTRQVALD
jgi:hypothetical protein